MMLLRATLTGWTYKNKDILNFVLPGFTLLEILLQQWLEKSVKWVTIWRWDVLPKEWAVYRSFILHRS